MCIFSSVTQPCLALCNPVDCSSLSITNSLSLLTLTSIELMTPSNHLILCHPLLLPPSISPSTRVFSSESVLHISWPKYWSFSFSISPSDDYSGLISFRMDWLDLLAFYCMFIVLQSNRFKSKQIISSICFFILFGFFRCSHSWGKMHLTFGMGAKLPTAKENQTIVYKLCTLYSDERQKQYEERLPF